MIKNSEQAEFWGLGRLLSAVLCLLVMGMAPGCNGDDPSERGLLQGVVEFEKRLLSFELGGRIEALWVERGDRLERGDLVARIDDSLDRLQRAARESDVSRAQAQLELLEAGSRPEEVASMASRVRAAQAVEERLETNLARERELARQGVTPPAVADDLRAEFERARAERKALQHRLALLRNGPRRQEIEGARAQVQGLTIATELERLRVNKHVLAASQEGVVLDVLKREGEVVGPAMPVVSVGDTARPYIDVFVPQAELSRVRLGEKMDVRVDTYDQPLVGEVEHISEKAEFTPRFLFSEHERPHLVFRVRVRVEDPKRYLHAGLPAFVGELDQTR